MRSTRAMWWSPSSSAASAPRLGGRAPGAAARSRARPRAGAPSRRPRARRRCASARPRRTRRATDRGRRGRASGRRAAARRRARGRSRSSRSRAARAAPSSRGSSVQPYSARNCLGGLERIGGEPLRRPAVARRAARATGRGAISVARRLGGGERPRAEPVVVARRVRAARDRAGRRAVPPPRSAPHQIVVALVVVFGHARARTPRARDRSPVLGGAGGGLRRTAAARLLDGRASGADSTDWPTGSTRITPSPVHSTHTPPIGPPRGRHHRARDHAADPAGEPRRPRRTRRPRRQLDAHERLARAERDRAVAAELHDRQPAAQAGHVAVLPAQRRLEREHEVLAQVEDVVVERDRGELRARRAARSGSRRR